MCALKVNSIKEIMLKIFPHFDDYPLITKKCADYFLFKDIITMMAKKEHLKKENLQDIVNIRASLNSGLSEILKFSFPNTKPVPRQQIKYQEILDPEWIAGFTSGDGCFFINVEQGRNKCGIGVRLGFQISQHNRDEVWVSKFLNIIEMKSY